MSRLSKLNQVWKEEAFNGETEYPVSVLLNRIYKRRLSEVFPGFRIAGRRRLARSFRDLPITMRSLCLD